MTTEIARGIVAWLGTYALHSTLLVGAVWIFLRWRRMPDHLMRETLWKTALVGALLTTSLQGFVGGPVLAPRLSLPVEALPRTAETTADIALGVVPFLTPETPALDTGADTGAPDIGVRENEIRHTAGLRPSAPAAWPRETAAPVFTGPVGEAVDADSRGGLETLWIGLAVLWAAGAGFGLVRLTVARFRLAAMLGPRRPVSDTRIQATLTSLCARAGVPVPRLTSAAGLNVPVALGWTRARREICVPGRALTALSPAEQECMLAHELAHLVRRDPVWVVLSRVVEAAFFFQPLNRVARRELMESAEFLCDAWAVRQTGAPMTLARCLAEVADWIAGPTRGAPVAAMAQSRSTLMRRVGRLVNAGPSGDGRPRWWRRPAALVALVLVAGVTPAVTVAQDADEDLRQRERARARAEAEAEVAAHAAAQVAAEVAAELASQREALDELRRSHAEVLSALRRERSLREDSRGRRAAGFAQAEAEYARSQALFEQAQAADERHALEARLAELRARMRNGQTDLASLHDRLALVEQELDASDLQERSEELLDTLSVRRLDLADALVEREHELMALERETRDTQVRLDIVHELAHQQALVEAEQAQQIAEEESAEALRQDLFRDEAEAGQWLRSSRGADIRSTRDGRADRRWESRAETRADVRTGARAGSGSGDLVAALGEFESRQRRLVAERLHAHFVELANLTPEQAAGWQDQARQAAPLLLQALGGSTRLDRADDGTVEVSRAYGRVDEERLFRLAGELGVRDEIRREALVEAAFRVARELRPESATESLTPQEGMLPSLLR